MKIVKVLLTFAVEFVIIRGVIAPFFTGLFKNYILAPLGRWFKNDFIRTERELAIWMHYRNKSMNVGHNHNLNKCDDGMCRLI